MNKPTRVILGFIFGLILILLLWRRGSPTTEAQKAPVDGQRALRHQKPKPFASREAWEERRAQLEVPYENPIQAAMLWSNAFPEQAIRVSATIDALNVDVHLHALCLDQDNNPLEGVRVELSVRQWKGISRLDLFGDQLKFDRRSDGNGRFSLTGVRGDSLTVKTAVKDGYQLDTSGRLSLGFQGARVDPLSTPAAPFILRFWKKRGAEPLHVAKPGLRQKIATTGVPVAYDLKSGNKVAQSQNPVVRFAMRRNPESLPSQFKGNFDWQFTVEVPGGGVQTTQTNMPFLAPKDGYAAAASFGFKADDPQWSRETNAVLFFRTAQGQFGRMEVNVVSTTTGPVVSFGWTSYLNPTGSPVLEYDPAKILKSPSVTPTPAVRGAASQPPPAAVAPQPPPQQGHAPFVPQPPPGFQALTNRANPLAPPTPPRQQ